MIYPAFVSTEPWSTEPRRMSAQVLGVDFGKGPDRQVEVWWTRSVERDVMRQIARGRAEGNDRRLVRGGRWRAVIHALDGRLAILRVNA